MEYVAATYYGNMPLQYISLLDAYNMREYKPHYPGEGNVSFSNIKRQILGKGSLRDAFWGIWVAGILILKMFTLIAMDVYIYYTKDYDIRIFVHNNEELILLPYMVFAYVVVWRNTICVKKYWVIVARIITTLILYNTIYHAYQSI